MWNSLPPNDHALAPIRAALQGPAINGHGNLVSVTGNYRLKYESRVFGIYFIGGGGLYYRNSTLSQTVSVGNSVTCSPAWLWWGSVAPRRIKVSRASVLLCRAEMQALESHSEFPIQNTASTSSPDIITRLQKAYTRK